MTDPHSKEELAWRLLSEKYEALTPVAQRLIDAHAAQHANNAAFSAAIKARDDGSLTESDFITFRDANHAVWRVNEAEYNAATAALSAEYAATLAALNKEREESDD